MPSSAAVSVRPHHYSRGTQEPSPRVHPSLRLSPGAALAVGGRKQPVPTLGFLSGACWTSGGQAAVSLPRASEHIIVPPGARGAAEVVVNHQRQGAGGAGAPSGTGACGWLTGRSSGGRHSDYRRRCWETASTGWEKACEGGCSPLSSRSAQCRASRLPFLAVVRARPESLGSGRKA